MPMCGGPAWTASTANANCQPSECQDGFPKRSPVGTFVGGASIEGVYDLSGNVAEWTVDYWASDFYQDAAAKLLDPVNTVETYSRVVRGGRFDSPLEDLRAASRDAENEGQGDERTGFRCACTPSCSGKSCGDDGCGGSCGSCDDGQTCTTDRCLVTEVTCSKGTSVGTSCVELVATAYSWDYARTICSKRGGYLATVASEAENVALRTFADTLTQCKGKSLWLGASDAAAEGSWVWEDASIMNYSNWALQPPNNVGVGEDYLLMLGSGEWDDSPSSGAPCFVCEYPARPTGTLCQNVAFNCP